MSEKTLVILKPDALYRKLVGRSFPVLNGLAWTWWR